MHDESTERAAQEFLAAKLAEEEQLSEGRLNQEAAMALGPVVWKRIADSVLAKCREWNSITNEQTLTWKETLLGDLRILCSGRSQQLTVHFDSRKLLVVIKNTARLEHETDAVLRVEGYRTAIGRDAQLVRNGMPVNIDLLILGELRVLAGMSRQANAKG
ncbi:MAG TPA: hypothetical protein VK525_20790 [Candidatus Saccharimonadales bacterium]|jgi:hypothetical protein|nr:hypothetical protein [Candidatus Saccharimonadales bacterium]